MNKSQDIRIKVYTSVGLMILLFVVYWPLKDNLMCRYYDDNIYVTDNPMVNTGLTARNIKWAFTEFHAGNYHPVTWIAHMAGVSIFGNNPAGHHFINLLFHMVNTLLLLFFLYKSTGKYFFSLLIASVFALHPQNVESVAWAAELKNLLSTFFIFLALIAHLTYLKKKSITGYILSLLFFTLSLLSKPMFVTFPFFLLLLEFWPWNNRNLIVLTCDLFTNKKKEKNSSILFLENLSGVLKDKIPFIIIAILFSVVAVMSQKEGGTVAKIQTFPFFNRFEIISTGYFKYIYKFFIPYNYSTLYPINLKPSLLISSISFAFLGITTATIFKYAIKIPWLFVGWLWYLGLLIPVIGIVQIGGQSFADRYAYVPIIGITIILASISIKLAALHKYVKWTIIATIALFIALISFQTNSLIKTWRNDGTLFMNAINSTKNNYIANNYYGIYLSKTEKKHSEAISYFQTASAIKKNYTNSLTNIAKILIDSGNIIGGMNYAQQALNIKKDDVMANLIFAQGYQKLDSVNLTCKYYEKAIKHSTIMRKWKLLNNLGMYLAEKKMYSEALACFNRALIVQPDKTLLILNKARILLLTNKVEKALLCYTYLTQELYPDNCILKITISEILLEFDLKSHARTILLDAKNNCGQKDGNVQKEIKKRLERTES